MDKSKIFIFIAIIIAVFLFFNPFNSLKNQQNKIAMPKVADETATTFAEAIKQNFQKPEDFIIGAFKTHDIIFLGEYWRVKQNLKFVQDMIPLLYANGITDMGVECALYEDQAAIDALVTDKVYNENWAYKLLFNYLVIWGYQDYADIFKAAWSFNRTLAADQKPFRITGLSVKQNFNPINKPEDVENPEILKLVYAKGIPDVYMADVIKKEFIAANKKALIFAHTHTGFTRFKYQEFREKMEKLGFKDYKKAGQLIYDEIGSKVMNILIHGPMPSDKNYTGIDYPVQGILDAVVKILPEQRWRSGFYTNRSPFNSLVIDSTAYKKGYVALLLGDFCDAYLILNPITEQQPVSQIPNFIGSKNIEAANYNFIGSKAKTLTAEEINKLISDDLTELNKALRSFQ